MAITQKQRALPMNARRIAQICDVLKAHSVITLSRLEGLEAVECGYKTDNTPPAEGWQPLQFLHGAEKHFWIRGNIKTPASQPGRRYLLIAGSLTTGWDATNPQGLLYLDGKMVQGLDTNHREVFLEADRQYQMHCYYYTGIATQPLPMDFILCQLDQETEGMYYDLFVPLSALEVLNENTTEFRNTLSCLEQAVNLLDLRSPYSDGWYAGIRAARAFMEQEYYQKLCSPEGKPIVHCIGHTHIDVEWKWARQQTREKVQRSISTAKALMDDYPEYLFTLTQPELYRYLKEDAPEKYEELKSLVEQGRWEPEGSMWVECDCNLVSGESFVRQLLQGKKFFRDEFGKENKVLFLPDVFGYSAALPQILKKSGVEYFVTSKISWNDTNTVPYDIFKWQGIDGSEVLTTFITARWGMRDHAYNRISTYVGTITPAFVMGTWDRHQQKEFTKHTLLTYGFGDGGGGPTRHMLEMQRRLCRGLPGLPVTKMDHILPYLEDAKEEFESNCEKLRRVPRWVGELYLEFHRGTYTSLAKNKRHNRKCELGLQKIEALSYTDLLLGGSYDADGIYYAWRKVLHNQFHDILPGSSIREVYEGTDRDYARLGAFCNDTAKEKLEAIAKKVQTDGGLLVYNPLGFARGGLLQVEGKTVELQESIPGFGWKVIKPAGADNLVTIQGLTAENPYYRMELDESGRIVSLFDKEAGREVVLPGQKANEFQLFEDQPYEYDNWELSSYHKYRQYPMDDPAVIEPITDGSRSGFKVSRKYMSSTISQNIWLYSSNRRIDFDTQIDWHETHQVMKIAFPIDVHTERAAYEIQFGHAYRPTHQNTSWDAARFEVCAHKWVDVSDNGYGVSLVNDCKYGFSTEGSTLKMTVLKCGTDPHPEADQELHVFSYALIPHSGSLYEAGIPQQAHSFNQPLQAIAVSPQAGTLKDQFSLVSCDTPNVILETVKKAEADESMVVRMYEAYDSRSTATVKVAPIFKKAYLCDLMEQVQQELSLQDGCVTLPIRNFEIITLKFTK